MGAGVALAQPSTSGWLLDTHTWIWLHTGTLAARPEDLDTLRQAATERRWFVSSFSLSEVAFAVARKRLQLDRPLLAWFNAALQHPGPRILDVTAEIATATLQLPATFHGDPGDRILASTAIALNLTLCTHDDLLLRFGKQGLFRTMKVNETKE